MGFSRRQFLHASVQSLSLLAALPAGAYAITKTNHYPFSLGVASGSPLAHGIVLWTRILENPLARTLSPQRYQVRWEIALDEEFKKIQQQGETLAIPELAHSVHIEVEGLSPNTPYWYRFHLGDASSPVGHTRTAPAASDTLKNLRIAVASCQHWEFGEYVAYRHMVAQQPDLILFLGDYIYEWGPYDTKHPSKPRPRSDESFTLDEYRRRYAQYKSDPLLQAAHHHAPWLMVWDDHEVANDYANDRDEKLSTDFLTRRAAAYQAFYEHLPVRLPKDFRGSFQQFRIFQTVDFGTLVRFHMLDARQYRHHQACPGTGKGGSNVTSAAECTMLRDDKRSFLGIDQERWLAHSFASSQARWNIIGQQTLMAQFTYTPTTDENEMRVWTDGWDGYPTARVRLFDDIARYRPANPIVVSGDVHTFYAADLKRDFNKPTSPLNPVLATEFCGTSITSPGRPQPRTDQLVELNPHLAYGRSDTRGYMLLDVSYRHCEVQFVGMQDLKTDSNSKILKNYLIENGKAGIPPQQRG